MAETAHTVNSLERGRATLTGSTLRAHAYRKQAFELSEINTEIEVQTEQIRTGALAPETVEVGPHDWSRINRDVGDLARSQAARPFERRIEHDLHTLTAA